MGLGVREWAARDGEGSSGLGFYYVVECGSGLLANCGPGLIF